MDPRTLPVNPLLTLLDANTDGDHRYLLFSATFPKRLQKLAAKFLDTDHIHVSIGRTGSVHVNVKQNVCSRPHGRIRVAN